jgi:hypothetical protein
VQKCCDFPHREQVVVIKKGLSLRLVVVRGQGFHRTPAFLMQLHAHGGGMVLRAMARRGMVTKIITTDRIIIAANPLTMADKVVI